jgi:hypothetical protein
MSDASHEKLSAHSDLIIRPVEPDDTESVHRLLREHLNDVVADYSRWRVRWEWQYWNNPFRFGRPAGYVLQHDDSIVGHLGAVYLPLRIGMDRYTGVVGSDYVVSKDATKVGGMFAGLQLAERLFTDAEYFLVMATTANDKTNAVFSRFGCKPIPWTREFWRAPADAGQLVRTFYGGTNRVIRRILAAPGGFWLTRQLGNLCRIFHHYPKINLPKGCCLEISIPRSPCALGTVHEKQLSEKDAFNHQEPSEASLPRPALFSVDRSQDYLHWRYVSHPERDNIRVIAVTDEQGAPLGAAIVFLEKTEGRYIAHLEELVVLLNRPDVLHTLFCTAVDLACRQGVDYLVTTSGRPAYRHFFWELGFEARTRNAPAAVIQAGSKGVAEQVLPRPLENHLEFWHGEMF